MILDSIKLFTLEKEYKVGHRLKEKNADRIDQNTLFSRSNLRGSVVQF